VTVAKVKADQEQTAFQRLMFSALARKGLQGQNASAFLKGGVDQRRTALHKVQTNVTPIPKTNDRQTGLGCTADWFKGNKATRWPKTGTSSLQWYRRVIEPTQCTAQVKNRAPNPALDHRLLESHRRCSRKAAEGSLTCTTHGATGRNRGTLVELRPEETPVLLCDR
jgi:predicted P-loop ATPase